MITEARIEVIPGRLSKYNNAVMRDVMQFHESEWSAAEVDIKNYKNVASAYGAYKTAAKRLRVAVVPITRGGASCFLSETELPKVRVSDDEKQQIRADPLPSVRIRKAQAARTVTEGIRAGREASG